MADMWIKRKDNGKILSNICPGWGGWVYPFGLVEVPTLTGVPYLMETGVMTVRCTATFRFRKDRENASLDNYIELMMYIKNRGILLFKDQEGFVTEVQVSKPPAEPGSDGGFAVPKSLMETIYDVPLNLLKTGFIA